MRLQIITPVFPPAVGGIESLAYGLAERWSGPVQVLTLDEPGARDRDRAGPFDVRRSGNVPRGGRRALARLTAATPAHTRSFRPHVVLNMHVRCGYAAALSRSFSGARWVQYYHAKEVPTWPSATRWCAARSDRGIAVSAYTRSLVRTVAGPVGSLTVVPPGITPPGTPGTLLRDPRPTVLTVSRIDDDYKGHDVLLDALPTVLERVPAARWVVAGAGRRLDHLRAEVTRRGLDGAVEVLGLVDDAARDRLFATADVFALPSRTSVDGRTGEGFGIVYAEAAAAGLPVVAGNSGGSLDAVRHGVTGLLVDPSSPYEVAHALTTLLSEPDRCRRMSEAARAWSRQFDWDVVAAAVREVASV